MRVQTDENVPSAPRNRRRRLLAVVAVLAVALAVVLWLVSGHDGAAAPGVPAAASTSSGAPSSVVPSSAAPSSGANGAELPADQLPPSLAAVSLDATARVDDGIAARLEDLEAINGKGVGPGNVAGPALRVTVRIENRSREAVGLDGVAVHLTSGEDRVPAPRVNDPSSAPFAGTLEAGDTAEGVYVFTLPEADRDLVSVSVGYQPGAPFMVFTGSAR